MASGNSSSNPLSIQCLAVSCKGLSLIHVRPADGRRAVLGHVMQDGRRPTKTNVRQLIRMQAGHVPAERVSEDYVGSTYACPPASRRSALKEDRGATAPLASGRSLHFQERSLHFQAQQRAAGVASCSHCRHNRVDRRRWCRAPSPFGGMPCRSNSAQARSSPRTPNRFFDSVAGIAHLRTEACGRPRESCMVAEILETVTLQPVEKQFRAGVVGYETSPMAFPGGPLNLVS
jgi:hypothetical protein